MSRKKIPSEELVLRALHTAQFDHNTGRITPSAFSGEEVSLSRLKIRSVEEIFGFFFRDLDKPDRAVAAAAKFQVGKLVEAAATHVKPLEIAVVEDPLQCNDSHAVVDKPIDARGLQKRLLEARDDVLLAEDFRVRLDRSAQAS